MKYRKTSALSSELEALVTLADQLGNGAIVLDTSASTTAIAEQLAAVLSPHKTARLRTALNRLVERAHGRRSAPATRL